MLTLRTIGRLSVFFFSIQAFAGDMGITPPANWYLSGGIGAYENANGTKNARVFISTLETDSLVQENQRHFPVLNLSLKKNINKSFSVTAHAPK